MATQLSPGVQVREIDLTNFIPATGTAGGATVGQFHWGPVNQYTIINDTNTLTSIFGKPTDANYVDWFSCSNFLAYTDNLNIIRVVDSTSDTPALNSSVDGSGFRVDNESHYVNLIASGSGSTEVFTARYPGVLGDSIKVSMCDAGTYDSWEYKYQFDFAPGTSEYAAALGSANDELHVVVVDEDGKFTGVPGEILERYSFVSKARDAKGLDNEPIFYGTVINNTSNYVWYFSPVTGSSYLDLLKSVESVTVGGTPGPTAGFGSNYGLPIITFTDDATGTPEDPAGTGAAGEAVLNDDGSITSIVITNPGTGYSASVSATITDSGEDATAQVTSLVGGVVTTVSPITEGNSYRTATVTVTDQGSGATATANLAATGVVKTVTLNNASTALGDGPHTATLTNVGGATSDATVSFDVATGTASNLQLTDAGAGYTGTTFTAVVALDGVADDVTVDIVIGYDLSTITVDTGGTDYGTASTIDVALTGGNPDTAATAAVTTVTSGVVAAITVTGGSGALYETAPTVAITPGGSGATVTAVIGDIGTPTEGQITSYVVTAGGTNYGNPAVTVAPGGSGATITLVTMADEDTAGTNWATNAADSSGNPVTFYSLKSVSDGAWASSLSGGADGADAAASDYIAGWNLFQNAEEVDVSLLFTGNGGGSDTNRTIIRHVIDNVCEIRRDCMVFFSPNLTDVLNETQPGAIANITDFVADPATGVNRNTSFAVCDSGWKMQYDVFSDKYRWIPLNADVAGLSARTETDFDAWWSPAGLNRGQIKNVVSLAFNPNKTSRDELYKKNVNSVVSFTGEGVVLYGDRTQLKKGSAFSYINVRRLFIVLEKSIARASRYQLFEFNDTFTRSQFVGMVEPYLRTVQAKRGIQNFRVVCDETNNTGEIIDRGEFVASIYIKPARSINFITLNFIAVRTGVEFSEVVGAV
jgi:hypothetical protein